MQQRSDSKRPLLSTPPLPKSTPPDPPYELIEFSSQQYTNTTPGKQHNEISKKEDERKCDLCGSSTAQFQCDLCTKQKFCISCDQMYHRHPKRQMHVRKKLQTLTEEKFEPPLPPKGELSAAPVPPPRRNKGSSKMGMLNPMQQRTGAFKKDGSLMGSLKRFVGGIHTAPSQNKAIRRDKESKFRHMAHLVDFDQQSGSRDSGYLEWDTESRHRSGSFSTLHRSTFPPLIQAQSMAQLNCPNCHVHGMSAWDWNRSQMNLNAFPPWPGGLVSGNTWHGSVMFPPSYRIPASELPRRNSQYSQRHSRKIHKYSSEDDFESDLSISDDRKFKKRSSPSVRAVSPAMSRRSRHTVPSDTEEETTLRKSDRRYKKRNLVPSREPSPTPSRRSYRKKYEDEDTRSVKSVGNRRTSKSSNHKTFLRKSVKHASTDSDDELTSDRDASDRVSLSGSQSESTHNRFIPKPIRNNTEIQFEPQEFQKTTRVATKSIENTANNSSIPLSKNKSMPSNNNNWECQHCTYVNPSLSRVCDVCCKSKATQVQKIQTDMEDSMLAESMKKLNVSTVDTEETKKGDHTSDQEEIKRKVKKTISTGTSPPPQTISTQTYDVPINAGKRSRSFSCDDYSDWNPIKKSTSIVSFTSDQQSQSFREDSSGSTDYMKTLLQKHNEHGKEIFKLLKEAEQMEFTIEDLTVALAQCGDTNPIKWLSDNWSNMIDAVITIATNYGREQPENTIGTLSALEARAALQLHSGDIWAAAMECTRQRQKKYSQLMSKGCFTREDVVTVLTANHGNLEAAYKELNKNQLKPFLMKIWGPPQGIDNESGYTHDLYSNDHHNDIDVKPSKNYLAKNISRIQSWLEVLNIHESEVYKSWDTDSYFQNQNWLVNQNAGSFTSETSKRSTFTRYKSCDNLTVTAKDRLLSKVQFHQSLETLHQNPIRHEFPSKACSCKYDNDTYLILNKHQEENISNYIMNEYTKFRKRTHSYEKNKRMNNDTENEVEETNLIMDSPTKSEFNQKNINYYSSQNSHLHQETKHLDVSVSALEFADDFSLPTQSAKVPISDDKYIHDQSPETENTSTNVSSLQMLNKTFIIETPATATLSIPAVCKHTFVRPSETERTNLIVSYDGELNTEHDNTRKFSTQMVDTTASIPPEYIKYMDSLNHVISSNKQLQKPNQHISTCIADAFQNHEQFFYEMNVYETTLGTEDNNTHTRHVLTSVLPIHNNYSPQTEKRVLLTDLKAPDFSENSSINLDIHTEYVRSEYSEQEIFIELHALYLLALAGLDHYIINEKDTAVHNSLCQINSNKTLNFEEDKPVSHLQESGYQSIISVSSKNERNIKEKAEKTSEIYETQLNSSFFEKMTENYSNSTENLNSADKPPSNTKIISFVNQCDTEESLHLTTEKNHKLKITDFNFESPKETLKICLISNLGHSSTDHKSVINPVNENDLLPKRGIDAEIPLGVSKENQGHLHETVKSNSSFMNTLKNHSDSLIIKNENRLTGELITECEISKTLPNDSRNLTHKSITKTIPSTEINEGKQRPEITMNRLTYKTRTKEITAGSFAVKMQPEISSSPRNLEKENIIYEKSKLETESENELFYEEITDSSGKESEEYQESDSVFHQEHSTREVFDIEADKILEHHVSKKYTNYEENRADIDNKVNKDSNYVHLIVTDQVLNVGETTHRTDYRENKNHVDKKKRQKYNTNQMNLITEGGYENRKTDNLANEEETSNTEEISDFLKQLNNFVLESEDQSLPKIQKNKFKNGNKDIALVSRNKDNTKNHQNNKDDQSDKADMNMCQFKNIKIPIQEELSKNDESKLLNNNELNFEEHKESNIQHKNKKLLTDNYTINADKNIEVHETKENSLQARAHRCLSEGLFENYKQAELAAQLMELAFDRSQSIEAAIECSSVHAAITYLQQECQLCAEKFTMKQMISMLECEHRCCQECAKHFFSVQINEKSIDDCVCPFCKEPQIHHLDPDAVFNYFSNLDILLKTILQPKVHELFQQKLRDRTLMRDPNFKWCSKCSFGFIVEFERKQLICPSCKVISCSKCGKEWTKEHIGKTCDEYIQWLKSNNDLHSDLLSYLDDFGVTCPRCNTKFILVKGGCMHLTCTHCKYEFCSDCYKPFFMGADCKLSEYCTKLGLHAHHPRNCLFYLRDKEPQELKQLLLDNSVELNLKTSTATRCTIQLQKETDNGLIDMQCGAKVEESDLCRTHYIEYLTNLIRKNKIDPVVIFDLTEILQEFRRRGKSVPIRPANIFEHEYRRQCIQVVKEELPLE